jgi:hypothetical protein
MFEPDPAPEPDIERDQEDTIDQIFEAVNENLKTNKIKN